MSIQKAEMSIEQIENGQIVEHVAYPYVEYEHVTMENGMDIMSMIRDDVSTPTVTHDATSWRVGQGDGDVSKSIVDSSVASMTIKGQTYQNILPSPSLRNSMTNGKTMQKLNEGYDSVNTVDGRSKSAILKGQTEGIADRFEQGSYSNWNGSSFSPSAIQTRLRTKVVYSHIGTLTLSVNNGYQLFLRSIEIESGQEYTDGWFQSRSFNFSSERKFVIIISKVDNTNISVEEFGDVGFETNFTKMTELKSVKMPVLTTCGKNLFDGELEIGTVNADTGEPFDYKKRSRTVNFLNIKPNTSYSLKIFNDGYQFNRVFFYDSQKNYISNIIIDNCEKIVTSPENARYIKLIFKKQVDSNMEDNDLINISNIVQLEQGTQATPYEPYKSNILTVNEPIELRGIDDAKDELNLLTGEVVERIGEIVLNEDITGYQDTKYSVNGYSAFRVTSITNIPNGLINVICDKVKYYPNINLDWTKQEEFFTTNGNLLFVKILSTKASNFEELRTFLSSSPITIQYELAESIKTVDLSILDQDNQPTTQLNSFANGYIQVSSQGLIPSVDYEVPTSNSYHVDLMKPNTQYTMKNMQGTFTIDNIQYNASTNGTFTSPSALTNNFMITSVAQSQPMLLEGDVREKDIPYFTGIKSAFEGEDKIEVLSTGKNLWTGADNYINSGANIIIHDENQCVFEHHAVNNGIKVKVSDYEYQTITISYDFEILDGKALNVGGHNRHQTKAYYIDGINVGTSYHNGHVTTYEKNRVYHVDHVVHINLPISEGQYNDREHIGIEPNRYSADTPTYCKMRVTNFQITLGNVIQEYEPRKSNSTKIPLLSPLRSLPNGVYDELIIDRMKKKATLIQRIKSTVFNGGEDWNLNNYSHDKLIEFVCHSGAQMAHTVFSDRFITGGENVERVAFSGGSIYIRILKTKVSNVDSFKKWLSQNPLTVQYGLQTPLITEVNLEGYPYVYKGGHIFLNTEIAPTTEVTYSINQAHQIESSNEDILRHQNEINHLYQLIAQYVQVQYEAELIDIALQG